MSAGAEPDPGGVGEFRACLVGEPAGLEGGVSGEFLLNVVDAAGYRGGFQGGLVGGEFGFLGGAEDAGGEEPVVGRPLCQP